MYSDNKMVLQLMSLLKQFEIRRIVVSPGSRHFAFVHSLEADNYFKLYPKSNAFKFTSNSLAGTVDFKISIHFS